MRHDPLIFTRCGHPRDAANTYVAPKTGAQSCRKCRNERSQQAAEMRTRSGIPNAIRRAEKRLEQLYREANCAVAHDLKFKFVVDEAWDRETETAKLEAALRGQDNTMLGMDSQGALHGQKRSA